MTNNLHIYCKICHGTGSRVEKGEEHQTYCDCPIGLALGAAWMGTGHEEEIVKAIENMRDYMAGFSHE
jgi:hypothetical protein